MTTESDFMADPVTATFGAGGIFANAFPGYEPRAGQVALVDHFSAAIERGGVALGEGPCGTGKSMAYLVPAIHYAISRRRKVVIATAGIALQEQLVTKDLPLLRDLLPVKFSFASLKGRQNYLCRSRLSATACAAGLSPSQDVIDAIGEQEAMDLLTADSLGVQVLEPAERRETMEILTWAEGTETGDVSELSFVPSNGLWRRRFAVSSDECHRSECAYAKSCFYERACNEAAAADVVVVNYHLLLAHLSVRRATGRDLVLPSFGLLVCDEAHEFADIARDFLGWELSQGVIDRLVRWTEGNALGNASRLALYMARFFDTCRDYAADRARRTNGAQSGGPLCQRIIPGWSSALTEPMLSLGGESLAQAIVNEIDIVRELALRVADGDTTHLVRSKNIDTAKEMALASQVAKMASHASERILAAVNCEEPKENVYSIESSNGRTKLRCQLINPGKVIADQIWGAFNARFDKADPPSSIQSVLMTSATLTTGGTFDFVRAELGAPADATVLEVESPFDFENQARLVLPAIDLMPTDPGFASTVACVVADVAFAAGGRTMALFTSYRGLHAAAQEIAARNASRADGERLTVLRQGDAPRMDLIADFRRAFVAGKPAVLLGTDSFWTGVDLPGEALTALVIDKLPFPSPVEPLVEAVTELNPRGVFGDFMVPRAAMMLRQGVGRLIRTRTDVGVVVLCDGRLLSKGYGRAFVRSLPPMPMLRTLDELTGFLASQKKGQVVEQG